MTIIRSDPRSYIKVLISDVILDGTVFTGGQKPSSRNLLVFRHEPVIFTGYCLKRGMKEGIVNVGVSWIFFFIFVRYYMKVSGDKVLTERTESQVFVEKVLLKSVSYLTSHINTTSGRRTYSKSMRVIVRCTLFNLFKCRCSSLCIFPLLYVKNFLVHNIRNDYINRVCNM